MTSIIYNIDKKISNYNSGKTDYERRMAVELALANLRNGLSGMNYLL